MSPWCSWTWADGKLNKKGNWEETLSCFELLPEGILRKAQGLAFYVFAGQTYLLFFFFSGIFENETNVGLWMC